jgi:hypothetical protein
MSRILGLMRFAQKSPSSSIFKVRDDAHGVESVGRYSEIMGIVSAKAVNLSHYIYTTLVNGIVFRVAICGQIVLEPLPQWATKEATGATERGWKIWWRHPRTT